MQSWVSSLYRRRLRMHPLRTSRAPGVVGGEIILDFESIVVFSPLDASRQFPSCYSQCRGVTGPERRVLGSPECTDLSHGFRLGWTVVILNILNILPVIPCDCWRVLLQVHISICCGCLSERLSISAFKAALQHSFCFHRPHSVFCVCFLDFRAQLEAKTIMIEVRSVRPHTPQGAYINTWEISGRINTQ